MSKRARERKEQALRAVTDDANRRPGAVVSLKHPAQRYKDVVFRGRLTEEGRKVVFVEEGSWIRVSVDVPERMESSGREAMAWRDTQLYNALRGEHAKANRKTVLAARKKAAADQTPKAPGDLEVKGRRSASQLTYAWNGFEVAVTPREHRPALSEGASAWKRARARETTPERALRKITDKVKRSLDKAVRGEHEAIVARAEPADAPTAGAAVDERERHPAISKLDDPVVLGILRAAYEFLGSDRLHYCSNCDEEWPVFDGAWPQAGIFCAGSRAGYCETIKEAGYTADQRKPDRCSRCASSSAYGKMYCAENLQHLGARHAAL